ncbi:MAG: hypothetical protein JWR16_3463 [Nevskia sp.]|nr:hypothetical protein [Nevskia sp.]
MWLINYQGVAVHVVGDLLANEAEVRAAAIAAADISDAVRAIGAVFYRSGYPATLLTYAVADDRDLYVRVVAGKVAEIDGAESLKPYFRSLVSDRPLREAALERARALGDSFSERAGENYQPSFRPLGPDSVALDLGSPSAGNEQLALAADFNNSGNRYAGPYLADLSVRQSLGSGDEVTLGGSTSVNVFDIGGGDSRPYHEGDGSWSRVTRYGVFGVEGRYAAFGQDVQGIRLDGRLSSAAASWLLPLYADFDHRVLLQTRVDRSDENVDARLLDPAAPPPPLSIANLLRILGLTTAPVTRAEVLSELYNSAEIDLSGVARLDLGDHPLELNAGIALRKGLSDSGNAQSAASLSYFLLRPNLSLRYSFASQWDAVADVKAQLGNSVVPQLEQFVIGGPTSLHAYDTGVGIGDHGEDAHVGVEWHGRDDSFAARYSIKPRAFVEYGAAKLERSALDETAGSVKLADIGLSLEAKPISAITTTLSVAQSIYSHGDQNGPVGDSRKYFFFQIAGRY